MVNKAQKQWPLQAHKTKPYIFDGIMTASALGREQLVIIVFTIGLAIFLVEIVRIQWFDTLGALETIGMIVLAHCFDVVVLFRHGSRFKSPQRKR